MKSYTVAEYLDAGCPELKIASMMLVHGITGGRVCDTGCHAFNGGGCQYYRNLISGKTPTKYAETVRQEAERRGVSIKTVRRERRDNQS